MQESPIIGRRGLADYVDRRGPCRRVGALRNHDGVGGRQRHILPGWHGGSQRVDRRELTGQQRNAPLQSLIVQDRPARQMCHEERWILAMRGGRINRDQYRSRDAGPREQGQGAGLPVQPALGVLHVDEVRSTRSRGLRPACDGQPPHFGSDAAAQRLDSDDPFADLQVPTHPSQFQRSCSVRNSTGTRRAVASTHARPAIFPRTPAGAVSHSREPRLPRPVGDSPSLAAPVRKSARRWCGGAPGVGASPHGGVVVLGDLASALLRGGDVDQRVYISHQLAAATQA